jgi:hypothetical protein
MEIAVSALKTKIISVNVPASRPGSPTEAEIRFLTHRLEIVKSWDDSERKKASLEAIELRLKVLRGHSNS